jgi:hypothetical protein
MLEKSGLTSTLAAHCINLSLSKKIIIKIANEGHIESRTQVAGMRE